jgi:hypothetical protein
MKIILFITMLCSIAIEGIALTESTNRTKADTLKGVEEKRNLLKRRMDLQGASQLPYEYPNINGDNKKIYGLTGLEITTCIARYIYIDLNRQKRFSKNLWCSLISHFDVKNKNFTPIFLCWNNTPCDLRGLLVTLDTNYQIIDTLEVAIAGNHEDRILTKQYQLDTDLTLIVYDLRPTSDKILRYQMDQIDTYDAQRVDTHYKIDDNGKFIKLKEIFYKPKTYTIEELYYYKNHRIGNGKEEKL